MAILTGIEDSEDELAVASGARLCVGRLCVAAGRAEAGRLFVAAERAGAEDRLVGLAAEDDGLRARDAVRVVGAELEATALRAAGLRAAGLPAAGLRAAGLPAAGLRALLLLAALAEPPSLGFAAARVGVLAAFVVAAGLVVARARLVPGLVVARVALPAASPLVDLAPVVLRGVLEVFLVSVAVAMEPQFWSLFKWCYPGISDQ